MARFALDDQIAAQPGAVRDLLAGLEVPPLAPDRPVVLAGQGTSLHACRIAAAWAVWLSDGAVRPHAVEAHHLALHWPLQRGEQVVVVSHRGTKRFPRRCLQRSRRAGAWTLAVTGQGAAEVGADAVVRTCADETSATHTVSYLTALAALARLMEGLGEPERVGPLHAALEAVPDALERALEAPGPAETARRLAGCAPILVAGHELEAMTAAEAALKLKEGAYIWAEGMSVEEALHGPVAVYGPGCAAILIDPPSDDGGRIADLAGVCRAVGMTTIRCGPSAGADLPVPDVAAPVRPVVTVVALQRLVAELARVRGTNPDTIRTDEEPWAGAMKDLRL